MLSKQSVIHFVKWREVDNYPNYFVSNNGLVKKGSSLVRIGINPKRNGRPYVILERIVRSKHSANQRRLRKIVDLHRLVWDHFGSEPHKNGYEIHHVDLNYMNNHIDNMVLIPKSVHKSFHGKINNNLNKNKAA